MNPSPWLRLLVAVAVCIGATVAEAQDGEVQDKGTQDKGIQNTGVVDIGDQDSGPLFVSVVGLPSGMKAYAPGRWGTVAVIVGNRTQTPQVVQATVRVKGWEEVRFSRDVLVPARSVRYATIPIHLPESLPLNSTLEILGQVDSGLEIPKSEFANLASVVSPSDTAYIQDRSLTSSPQNGRVDFAYEAALAVRAANAWDRTMIVNDERMLPATYQGWDGVGNVIVVGDRLADNPAARQALREWLSKGGRMWIQADQTSVETIRLLLGSAVAIERVDQVALNEFAIQYAGKDFQGEPSLVQLEQPVQFTRVIVDGVEVMYEIDGWPALMKVDVGLGQVYFSMLEPRGLIRGRRSGDPTPRNERFYTDYIALEPLQQLAVGLRPAKVSEAVPAEVRADYVTQRIGYQVPSRRLVINVLLGFCGLIGLAAAGLSYWERRELLAWVTVGAAGFAAAALIAVGLTSHRGVPATASSFQVVEVLPDLNEVAFTGSVARYRSQLAPVQLASTHATRFDPQSERLQGKIRNYVWTDADRWQWGETILPTGVQLFPFQRYHSLARPVTATATFGPQGLAGTLQLDALRADALRAGALRAGALQDDGAEKTLQLADGVLVFPRSTALAANLTPAGTFAAGLDDSLPPHEFFNSTFVDSTQRQRRAIYQAWYDSYLARLDQTRYLVGWTDSLDSGLDWGQGVSQIDGALVAIPLTMQRTPANTKVYLPGSTLQVQSVASQHGHSNTFENATAQWIYPFSRSARTRLRFQLPAEVLPLRVDSAELFLDCNIPSRMLTIEVIEGDQRRTLFARLNPSGKQTIDLTETIPLTVDAEGGLTLEFTIAESTPTSSSPPARSSDPWSIRTTRLDVTGTTLPSAEVEPQR